MATTCEFPKKIICLGGGKNQSKRSVDLKKNYYYKSKWKGRKFKVYFCTLPNFYGCANAGKCAIAEITTMPMSVI